jgi:hypothetical protein
VASALLFVPAAAALAVAWLSPAPLRLRVARVASDPAARRVTRLFVVATNTSGGPIEPHFETATGVQASRFWVVRSGPRSIAPGATARYVLAAPDSFSQIPDGTPFMLDAVTAGPVTISSSHPFTAAGPPPAG